MTDLTDYKTASRLALSINAGASARLSRKDRECITADLEQRAAWLHGWDTTNEAENRAGRTMSGEPCAECGGGPVYCRHCMDATSMVGGV